MSLIGVLSGIGGINTLGVFNGTAYAATLQPTATLTINNGGTTNFSTNLNTKNGTTSALIAVPVKVEVEQTDKYSMGIYLDCTNAPGDCSNNSGGGGAALGALTDSEVTGTGSAVTKLDSIPSSMAFSSIDANHWGFWYLNNTTTPTVEGSSSTTIHPVPTTSTAGNAIAETATGASSAIVNGQLVFAVKADGNLASGSYSGKVVVTLTATPQEVADASFAGISTMQEMTPSICASAGANEEGTLQDTRDNKVYLVGKLADGRCWMLQNLALGKTTDITLEPSKSNIQSGKTFILPASSTAGFASATDVSVFAGSHTDQAADSLSNTGGYYSFNAANAIQSNGAPASSASVGDICPKGWRLPSGSVAGGEFTELTKKYGGNGGSNDTNIKYGSAFSNAFKAALVGSYSSGSLNSDGTSAFYRSSAEAPNGSGYYMYLYADAGSPQTSMAARGSGFSVRCISKPADTVAPAAPTLARVDYNTFSITSSDDSGIVAAFYVGTSNSKPNANASGWIPATNNSATYDVLQDGEHTYYVWAKDDSDNVSAVSTNTMRTYGVTLTSSTSLTINLRDGTAQDAPIILTRLPANHDDITSYVLDGSDVYVQVGTETETVGHITISFTGYADYADGSVCSELPGQIKAVYHPVLQTTTVLVTRLNINCS